MKKIVLAVALGTVMVLGVHSLSTGAPGGVPGQPCVVDPNIQCLMYVDPVTCIKPGYGWKTYSNACFAMKDCALMRTCYPGGGGPAPVPATF
jgi:hypothetical protein